MRDVNIRKVDEIVFFLAGSPGSNSRHYCHEPRQLCINVPRPVAPPPRGSGPRNVIYVLVGELQLIREATIHLCSCVQETVAKSSTGLTRDRRTLCKRHKPRHQVHTRAAGVRG